MKKRFELLLLPCIALLTTFCSGNEETPSKTPTPPAPTTEIVFSGETRTEYEAGNFFTCNNNVTFSPDTDESASLFFSRVQFHPDMPIQLDMTLPGVAYSLDETGDIVFSGDNIVPLALGGEFAIYTVHNLSGRIADSASISLTMTCGTYPVSYTGQTE